MTRLTLLFAFTLIALPTLALAVDYTALVEFPGRNNTTLDGSASFGDLINGLYVISIGIAALLAVIKVIIAGVKYMLSDVVTNKEEAKKDIKNALLGLIIVLGAVLILTIINPKLVDVNLSLNQTKKTTLSQSQPTVLNTSLIAKNNKVDTLPGYTSTVATPMTEDQKREWGKQQSLFLENCKNDGGHAISLSADVKCLKGMGGKVVHVMGTEGIEHVKSVNNNPRLLCNQTWQGDYRFIEDPEIADFGYCVKKDN